MQAADVNALSALPGSVTLQREGDQLVLCLSGEVDYAVVRRFYSIHGRRARPVDAIDAAAVSFMSASALGLLLLFLTTSQAAGRAAALRRSSACVNRLLYLTGLQTTFPRMT